MISSTGLVLETATSLGQVEALVVTGAASYPEDTFCNMVRKLSLINAGGLGGEGAVAIVLHKIFVTALDINGVDLKSSNTTAAVLLSRHSVPFASDN